MRCLRKCLLHALIWLTAASSVMAGTPHLQCRCPVQTVKATGAAAEGCCCCSPKVAQHDAPRSCCPASTKSSDDAATDAFRPDGCQKQLVPAADATMERVSVEGVQDVEWSFATRDWNAGATTSDPDHFNNLDSSHLPPPVDWQLVLQHFVI